jgi:tetratricopeptide (TPR) repeat protein
MITNSSLPSERLAFAHLAARRFEEAIEWADGALHEQPRFIVAIRAKIVANAHLGRLDEARADLGRMPAIDSKLTIAEWRAFALRYLRLSSSSSTSPACAWPACPRSEASRHRDFWGPLREPSVPEARRGCAHDRGLSALGTGRAL